MFRKLLATEFRQLTPFQLDQLEAHYNLLTKWNQKLNLTRINKLEDVVHLHYCESLFVATALPPGPLRIVDVGSGAGFPGIPIAILRPECSVTLVESHQRKAVFLREASRNLPNINVLSCRAEDVPEKFDWQVSRAIKLRSIQLALNKALLVTSERAANVQRLPWGENRRL